MTKQELKQFQAETDGMTFDELKAHLGVNSPAMPFKPSLSRLTVNVLAALPKTFAEFKRDHMRRVTGFNVAIGSGK